MKTSTPAETKIAAIAALSEDCNADFLLLHAKPVGERAACSTIVSGDTGILAHMILEYIRGERDTARFIHIHTLRHYRRPLQILTVLAVFGLVHACIDLYQYVEGL